MATALNKCPLSSSLQTQRWHKRRSLADPRYTQIESDTRERIACTGLPEVADLIVAAPALRDIALYVESVAPTESATADLDDSDTVEITVTVGSLRELREAIAKATGAA